MTNEELKSIRDRVADDVVLPTATTLALIDEVFASREGWSTASSLATRYAVESTERLARALKAEAERDTHAAEAERQMEYGVKQHEAAQDAIRARDEWKARAFVAETRRTISFLRGVETMREAAAARLDGEAINGVTSPYFGNLIRAITIPEPD